MIYFHILAFILAFSSSIHLLMANDAGYDNSKTKKIQIVYIKVPLASKTRNGDGNYAESNSPAGYAVADTNNHNNNINNNNNDVPNNQPSSPVQDYNQQNLAADLVAMLSKQHNNNNNNHNSNNHNNANQYEFNYEQLRKPSSNYQPAMNLNDGYQNNNNNHNNNGYKVHSASGHEYNQNSQPNIMPMIRPMNGHNMNQNGPINGYNGPMINVNSPQNGPQISHSGSNSPSPFRGNDFGNSEPFRDNIGKPMNMDISQAKPISDSNIGQFGGGAIGESTPFVPNEGIESGYNPADFFGPNPSAAFEENVGEAFPFGEMAFDSDLLNMGGMMSYNGDLTKAPSNQVKKNRGYGFMVSNALSNLGLMSDSNNNQMPIKGMAMAMSNQYPSFIGPKPGNNGQSNGLSGIRSRLTSLFMNRIPSFSLNNLSGLGSINTGLLGLLGL